MSGSDLVLTTNYILMFLGKYDIWHEYLNESASPGFQHVAKSLKMAGVKILILDFLMLMICSRITMSTGI